MRGILLHKLIALLFIWTGFSFTSQVYGLGENASRYAVASKLSTGKWIKLRVTGNAIYKLSYEEIKAMGIDDPSKVNIYGYGGWLLDEDFSKNNYVDDLPEVSVYLSNGSSGSFGPGDYLLFYGRGVTSWSYSPAGEYVHQNNPYATYGCYFLTQGDRGPKTMPLEPSVGGSEVSYSVFDDYALHEQDLTTAPEANSGRELFGESFVGGKSSQSFEFRIPGITVGDGLARLLFAAKALNSTRISMELNGQMLIDGSMSITSDSYEKGQLYNTSARWTGEKSEQVTVTVTYNSGTQIFASLDYIRLNFERELRGYNTAYTFFRKKESLNKTVTYTIKNATAGMLVFDVTGNYDARLMQTDFSNNELSFTVTSGSVLREFVLVEPNRDFSLKPVSLGEVKNQDLHSLPQTEMVIITPSIFGSYAETLAEEHRKRDNMHVTVALSDEIYNEFSSGVYDITAYRRFLKMFYDRAKSEEEKPKYLLLFGDGIFENRFITDATRGLNRDNFLLTYQVQESLSEYNSYGTDDYVGFLQDQNPSLANSDFSSIQLDLGIGRFPVRSTEQAADALAKLTGYMDNTSHGSWKNSICFSADDTETGRDTPFLHTGQADDLADYMHRTHPEYTISKVYMDAYKKSMTNGRTTYPEAKKKLNDVLKKGCFLYNYTGHGSVTDLSAENMASINDINQMTFTNLPLWITATCDFSWYDGISTSGGETVFLSKKSAGIGLISTTRVVYSDDNYKLNIKLLENLFRKDENGAYPRLGDVLRKSKNDLGGGNQLNYILLGDPALRLNYPSDEVRLTEINGVPLEKDKIYEFRAMDQITLSGMICNSSGAVDPEFNGTLNATIYDSQQTLKTIYTNEDSTLSFTDYPNVVYSGGGVVNEGRFTLKFTVPLDISYSESNGKINFYAYDETRGNEANGYFSGYKMNGTADDPIEDTEGPVIEYMYLNTSEFESGDAVNSTPCFVAEVYDESGINMSGSSLGHDITVSIDNSSVMTYNLNQYFESDAEEYGRGTITFPVPGLPDGKHKLLFRVWDIFNNPSTDSLEFYVDRQLKPQILDLTATQNPAREVTYFLLTSDRPETQVNIELQVYDLTGKKVWTHIENNVSGAWLESYPIEWNLRSDGGSRVSPGVYVYRASISTETSKEATKSKKIIVLGQ